MTIDEKIAIIERWAHKLDIDFTGDFYWYGRLIYGGGYGTKHIGPYNTDKSVVFNAYKLVNNMVWCVVNGH